MAQEISQFRVLGILVSFCVLTIQMQFAFGLWPTIKFLFWPSKGKSLGAPVLDCSWKVKTVIWKSFWGKWRQVISIQSQAGDGCWCMMLMYKFFTGNVWENSLKSGPYELSDLHRNYTNILHNAQIRASSAILSVFSVICLFLVIYQKIHHSLAAY